jgi:hypothetical protein
MHAAVDLISLAYGSLLTGRAREARDLLFGTLDYLASSGDTEAAADVLELAACIAAELGEGPRAARLAGAVSALRELAGMPISQEDADLLEGYLARARAATAPGEWDAALAAGRALTHEQAVTLLLSPSPAQPTTCSSDLSRGGACLTGSARIRWRRRARRFPAIFPSR